MPQGTVLSPRLFMVYVNNLLKMATVGNIVSNCDDTVIFCKAIAERDFFKYQIGSYVLLPIVIIFYIWDRYK